MSQSARSNYFRQMQAAGYEFTEHYRKYSANRLEELAKEAGIELVTFVREEPKPEGKRVAPLAQPQPQPQPQSAPQPSSEATPAPQGDWGAMPAQPEGFTPVPRIPGWPAKKA